MKKRCFIGIDCQNDFTDIPESQLPRDSSGDIMYRPALPVEGGHNDMMTLGKWLKKNYPFIAGFYLTQDSHHRLDISHPCWWKKEDGTNVDPFTPISHQDVMDGKYVPKLAHKRSMNYVKALEQNGEFGHFIWPYHCIMGTWGHNFHSAILEAIEVIEENGKWINFVTKGSNPFTEHFGPWRANIPDPTDPSTQLNQTLLNNFLSYDEVIIAGEARSHCVANGLKQLLEEVPSLAPKMVILTDCMSDVPGLPDEFYTEMNKIYEQAKQAGVRFETTQSYNFSN